MAAINAINVHPRTGVGIETYSLARIFSIGTVHPRTGVGIETGYGLLFNVLATFTPARGWGLKQCMANDWENQL